jgi:glycosyl transferase family 87
VLKSRRLWSWLGLGVIAAALALDVWHERGHIGIDFHTYLAAADVGLRQGWSHVYEQALVAAEQRRLVPTDPSQPFLSPPTVAWLVTPLTGLEFWTAFEIWAAFTFATFAASLAWSGVSAGIFRWIAVLAALSPWWVLHAVNLGQVVPVVAAGVVVGWRLLRDRKDIAAGVALSLVFLKPNTAILVPLALLAARRYRAFFSWVAVGAGLGALALLLLGTHGISDYINQLRAPLPPGADYLTLKGAAGATGMVATILRVLIAGAVLVAAYRLRGSSGLLIPVAIVGSLIVSPYLHASDLCLLSAAAWMVWEERPSLAWRVPLAVGWLLASPFLYLTGFSPDLTRWPWIEMALLVALVVMAWRPLTGSADLRTRAPA